jgi:UDP-N-acetylglucosamine--dolichyl-phosphate N-acetylglucosaminephosphotransferase
MLFTVSVSLAAYFGAFHLIPVLVPRLLKANRFGKDLNKAHRPIIPESCGLGPAVVFLIAALLCSLEVDQSDHARLNAALFSIAFMVLLGFVDDVLDLPWRYKIFLPLFACLPLLVSYNGPTSIVLPFRLGLLHMGPLYLVYMALFTVFCSNSINILAGINGLEVGSSIVIGLAIVAHLLLLGQMDLLVLVIVLPFLACSFALLRYNIFPSRVFVGDTYTVFAGMALACAGILGHHSKTVLLFFAPQILNFVISLPQLFGFVPCARHRLPKVLTEGKHKGKLEGQAEHWNLINVVLRFTGPLTEDALWRVMMIIQVGACVAGLVVRHYGSKLVFY